MQAQVIVFIRNDVTGEELNFSSIISVVKYLEKNKNVTINRNKIAKCLDTNTSYMGYTYYKGKS